MAAVSYNVHMPNRLRIGLLAGVLAGLGILLGYIWGAPRLLEVSPADGAVQISASSQVKIRFSRPINEQAIQEKLEFNPSIAGEFHWEEHTLIFTPELPWPAGATIQVRLLPGAPARHFPAIPLRQGLEWSFQIRQPQIVYLFPVNGPANLFLMDPLHGDRRALTDLEQGVIDFVVSANGESIYYSARRGIEHSAIYRLDLDGAVTQPGSEEELGRSAEVTPVLILDCPQALCGELALDPSGRYLAFERSLLPGSEGAHVPQVWVLPLAAEQVAAPMLAGAEDRQTLLPSWSKNGLLAVYDTAAQAYLFIDPLGGEVARFPNQTGQQGAWHPDGDAFLAAEIFYLNANVSPELANLESLADSHLILFDLESQQTEDLTPGDGIEDAMPVYSPDGKFLAFARKYLDVRRWSPGRQLWIAQTSSRDARQLTDDPVYNHFDFAWSPAGDQIAFVRFNQSVLSRPPEIWYYDFLTNNSKLLIEGGYQPQWIP